LKCDEARQRLLNDPEDLRALEHLQGCRECFEALEAADPVVSLLVAARPAEAPAPSSLAQAVLERWRPGRLRSVTIGIAIAIALVAVAIEALLGADPARLSIYGPGLVAAASSLAGGSLIAAQTAQSILLGTPPLLAALTTVTVLICAAWLKLARTVPQWRSAS